MTPATDRTAAGEQSMTPYADAVREYADRPFVRLDVPGHGADAVAQPELAQILGERVLALDVPPLVSGIDQGPRPTALQRSAQLAAEAWGAHRSWLLTNGGSKGNLVACLALRHLGEHVVAQRSMHSSVMDGMVLGGLVGHFVAPEVDAELGAAHGLTAQSLARALDEHPSAVAAYVVTPSYFGAVADVRAFAEVAHARAVALVVDEAWGAHFGFHPDLPANALAQGADLVVSSTHKLGGSLTQSALLHLGRGAFAERLEPLVSRAFLDRAAGRILLMGSAEGGVEIEQVASTIPRPSSATTRTRCWVCSTSRPASSPLPWVSVHI